MHKKTFWMVIAAGISSALASSAAQAIPVFARQTGQACNACHVSFPELTPYGRYFKLSGYTLGKRLEAYPNNVPLAVMGQIGVTSTSNNTYSDGSLVDPYNGKVKLEMASVFLAGKATDHAGGFAQWTYNGIAQQFGSDNTDLRLVNTHVAAGAKEPDLIYGLTVNNNPTSQDVWNSTPAWGYPFTFTGTGITPVFPGLTQIEGPLAQEVAGIGGYAFWKKSLYAEISAYRTANGLFSIFHLGHDPDSTTRPYVQGYNPYWRFAYNKEWGPSSLEVGTFGMTVDRFQNGVNGGPTDHFKDIGVDAQYQYITDVHTVTGQLSLIHENTDWNLSFPMGVTSNPSDSLRNFRAKVSYWYVHKYGATVGYFTGTGSADPTLYASSLSGSPDTRGYILELDYMPIDNVRLMAQYVGFNKYQGGSSYLDPAGGLRNASDNNSLFLNVWFAF